MGDGKGTYETSTLNPFETKSGGVEFNPQFKGDMEKINPINGERKGLDKMNKFECFNPDTKKGMRYVVEPSNIPNLKNERIDPITGRKLG